MTKTDQVAAVKEWITPENIHHLQSFLGLASYYRPFIAGFATVATPLYHLLRKDTPFERGQDQETAFNILTSWIPGRWPLWSYEEPVATKTDVLLGSEKMGC